MVVVVEEELRVEEGHQIMAPAPLRSALPEFKVWRPRRVATRQDRHELTRSLVHDRDVLLLPLRHAAHRLPPQACFCGYKPGETTMPIPLLPILRQTQSLFEVQVRPLLRKSSNRGFPTLAKSMLKQL